MTDVAVRVHDVRIVWREREREQERERERERRGKGGGKGKGKSKERERREKRGRRKEWGKTYAKCPRAVRVVFPLPYEDPTGAWVSLMLLCCSALPNPTLLHPTLLSSNPP